MPITPYLRPQDTITQILRNTATPAVARRNPVVIGPQYLIQLNDGRALNKTVFNSLGVVDYGYKLADGTDLDLGLYQPHAASVKLFGENLEAKVATLTSGAAITTAAKSNELRLALSTTNFKGSSIDNELLSTLDGRAVRVGDTVTVSGGGITARRTVTELIPRMYAGSLTPTAATTNLPTLGATATALVPLGHASWTAAASAAPPVGPFRAVGGGHMNGAARNLGEQFNFVVKSGTGDSTVFTVTALSAGTSVDITTGTVTGAGPYVFPVDLTDAGYPGVTVNLTRTTSSSANAGESFSVRVFPAYTAVAAPAASGTYTGSVDRRYVIEVTAAGTSAALTTFRIYDTSGAGTIQNGLLGSGALSLGTSGLTATPTASAFYYKGQKFLVDAKASAASSTEFNGLKLSGPIVDANTYTNAALTVSIFQLYTGEITAVNAPDGVALTATTSHTSYAASLGLPKSATGPTASGISPFADGIGKVYLSYKAAVIPGETEGAISITSASSMASLVGEPHLENWLGRGVFEAFSGNQSQRVYALRTIDDSVEAFTAALRKIRSTDVYYALAVMSDNIDVKQLVISHAEEMSNKFNKNFRRCYVGTDSPGRLEVWGRLSSGGYRLGSVASQIFTIDEPDRVHGVFTAEDLDSTIHIPSEGSFVISHVFNSYEVRLDCPVDLSVTSVAFSLIRSDTAANTVRFLAETAEVLSSRRCVNVWADRATTLSSLGSEVIPNKFIAAEIAGLRCALLPQQGLTMTEITSVTDAPSMYTRFTPEQLDTIASYGNMVITQESEGGDIFIRHQLTTSTTEGALAYEDNVGVIVDEFSYRVKDTFRSYIGKRNATQRTILEIQNKLFDLAVAATQTSIADFDIGPMAIRFFDETGTEGAVTARIDGVLADHILTYVKLRVPLPLNGIDHYIDVETSTEL